MPTGFPTLYKPGSKGKTQQWRTWVVEKDDGTAEIFVEHGQSGGKLQTTSTEITKGKNIGRANETTPIQQAISEAEADWKKKLDKGYSRTIELTRRFKPMLAQPFADHHEKISYPCYIQPKLDGFRCLAYEELGQIKLESRGSKFFTSVPHIAEAVRDLTKGMPKVTLDGELYRHDEKFQEISSVLRKQNPTEGSALIEYHVYDCYFPDNPEADYAKRLAFLLQLAKNRKRSSPIVIVPYFTASSYDEVFEKHKEFVARKYEGVIIRNISAKYEPDKRSYGLQKLKAFIDEEFEIIGAEEGKGKFKGMCVFVCETNDGTPFKCMPMGTEAERREYWTGRDRYIGKQLTVRFFEWTTSKARVPRHPVGVRIREDFDR